MTFVAVGVAAGGAVIAAGASTYAANKQAGAAKNAAQVQQNMFGQTQANEQPFVQAGQGAQTQLNYLLGIGPQNGGASSAGGYGSLNSPFTADTFKTLSPAYQFQANAGAQNTLNQDTSAAGGESGAALKDLTSFNQNFANTSFNNAFQQYQTQQNNTFSRLNGIATMGANAGSNNATNASGFAGGIGNSLTAAGTYGAAGTVGAANALAGGANNALAWREYGGGGGDPMPTPYQPPTTTPNATSGGNWDGSGSNY